MNTGNMHNKFGEVWPHGFRVMRANRQDRQTDRRIRPTILRNPNGAKY